MNKVLIAVDDSKGSAAATRVFTDLFPQGRQVTPILLYVEKIEGRSLMDEMLGIAELSTLKEQLQGTEYQEQLDRRAQAVLDFHKKALAESGVASVKTIVREGHPADEILAAASEEGAELLIIGSRGRRLHTLFMGSVSREIANRADIPVLIAR